MPKFDDVLTEIADQYGLEESDVTKLKEASPLRSQLAEKETEAAKVPGLQAEIDRLKRTPQVTKAFEDYGVDMSQLRPLEVQALEGLEPPEAGITPEWVAEQVDRYGWPISERTGEEGEEQVVEEPPAAQRIAAQATSPQANRGRSPTMTPADVPAMSADEWFAFRTEHPKEAELLMRGEEVPRPAS